MNATYPYMSKKLLASGLEPDTADMVWVNGLNLIHRDTIEALHDLSDSDILAWSSGAMLRMLPCEVEGFGEAYNHLTLRKYIDPEDGLAYYEVCYENERQETRHYGCSTELETALAYTLLSLLDNKII